MNIDIDVDGIDAAQLMLGKQPNAIKRAMSSSINRALTAGRTALSKGIRSEYNIKAGTIKGATKSEKATAASGKGVITVTGRPMDLMEFKPTIIRKGMVSVRIKKTRKSLPRSFFVDIGKKGIFHRVTTSRLPIEKEFTLSVAQMAGNVNVIDTVEDRMQRVFNDRFARAIEYGRD